MAKRYGSKYPRSGVHECMYGREQAEMVTALAIVNGVDAVTVVDWGDGQWREFSRDG